MRHRRPPIAPPHTRLSAIWTPQTGVLEAEPCPAKILENQALAEFLLGMTGRYLECIAKPDLEALPFTYEVREEAVGLLKLDVLDQIIVMGVDTANGPIERVLRSVEHMYQLSVRVDPDSPFAFVPIVTYGESSNYVYYVESMHGFVRTRPFFVESAVAFFAARILPNYLDDTTVPQYVAEMVRTGEDPGGLLDRQPLLRALMKGLPDVVRAETIRQIGAFTAAFAARR